MVEKQVAPLRVVPCQQGGGEGLVEPGVVGDEQHISFAAHFLVKRDDFGHRVLLTYSPQFFPARHIKTVHPPRALIDALGVGRHDADVTSPQLLALQVGVDHADIDHFVEGGVKAGRLHINMGQDPAIRVLRWPLHLGENRRRKQRGEKQQGQNTHAANLSTAAHATKVQSRTMLEFRQMALRRGTRLLLEDTSLQVHHGHKVGLTGANGTGKSSLFALILGELETDAGECSLPDDWVIAHVAQQSPSDERASIEYVLDGDAELRRLERDIEREGRSPCGETLAMLHGEFETIGGYTARSRAAQLMHGLGFVPGDEERPVNEFSGGWRMRLNLARALMCRSDLLLLDEPTNHLDLDAVIWLESWLKRYEGTLLLISHDRDFLDGVAGHIIHIEHGRAKLYTGNYSAFEQVRAAQLALQQAQYEKQQREIAHMQSYVDRFRYKASKAKQAQSRLKAIERMQKIAPAHVDSPFRFKLLEPEKLPQPLLKLDDISAGYGDHTVLSDVRLNLFPGDRVGLLGANGAGKSTLIKFLAGVLKPQAGETVPARDLRVGYFAQHQLDQLNPKRSPIEHLAEIDPGAREVELRNWLGGFGFSNDTVFMETEPFSGGEKSRLALALLIYQRPNLLLLDEPTNHLDLEMRQALAMALQEFSGAMVIVSHDRHLLRVSTDVLLLVDDGKVAEFDGGLDDYPTWLAQRSRKLGNKDQATESESTEVEPAGARNAEDRKARKRREAEERQRQAPLRKAVKISEAEVEKLSAEKKALEARLADGALYEAADKGELKDLLARQASLATELAEAEARWMAALEELEGETA